MYMCVYVCMSEQLTRTLNNARIHEIKVLLHAVVGFFVDHILIYTEYNKGYWIVCEMHMDVWCSSRLSSYRCETYMIC